MIQGLLRTNDYETVAQCLSFISVMAQQIAARESDQKAIKKEEVKKGKTSLELQKIVKPKLLSLALGTVSKQPDQAQIEFVHYSLEIVNICIQNAELRETILYEDMPGMKPIVELRAAIAKEENQESDPPNYCEFLKHIEK